MNVDSIQRGLVIDHIEAGRSMDIYKFLELDKLDCSVAIIRNARSKKSGKKDIIKIEDNVDIDLNVLGFVDPNITVNIINDGQIIAKKNLTLPDEVVNVVKCKNPRCITTIEQEIPQTFRRVETAGRSVYRCIYCEQEYEARKK